jgi:voltage-gated potassium channel
VGLVLFVTLVVVQLQRTVRAEHPLLRAIEAIGFAVAALLVVFAFTYLELSHADHGNFSEPLDRVAGLYFSATVMSTVGFGDIVAKTDVARLVVTLQIMLDFVLIAGIVRAVLAVARTGVQRQEAAARASARES